MKIIDCFTFYNEIDMLLYRLSVLDAVVDTFVLVEATLTYRGNPKPLFYNENKHLFAKFSHKIVHIIDDGLTPNPAVNPNLRRDDGVWQNENHQRNSIDKGIQQLALEPNDLLIIGDVDEIPNPDVVRNIRENNYIIDYVSLGQDLYYYNIMTVNSQKWYLSKIVSYDFYTNQLEREPQKCRNLISKLCIQRGGWHLSYFGDAHFIQNKLKEFSHQEFNQEKYTNIDEIQKKINSKGDLFSRDSEKWIHIPIEQNKFLPPRWEILQNMTVAKSMKIIDCFTFYNEIDMLLYRLSVLDPVVDKFVLVEATLTHRGNPKPLFYEKNKPLFAKFSHKIVHIIDDELIPNPREHSEVWSNEIHQRNSIDKGIRQLELKPNDLLIISDLDEIPNPEILRSIRENNTNIDYVSLSQDMYYYNLTVLHSNKWVSSKLVSYNNYVTLLNRTPQTCRYAITEKCINNGGWHLSYFGDAHFIQNKLKEFAHQEFNQEKYTNIDEIQKKMDNKEDLFSRDSEKWIHIPIEHNKCLPPNYPPAWASS